MQKNMKDAIENKYTDIFRQLYIDWMKQEKQEYQELENKCLSGSGVASNRMYKLIEKCIDKVIKELYMLFTEMPIKYNRKISLEILKKYIERSKENIDRHIERMEKDIKQIFNNDKLLITESNNIFINNLKNNYKTKLDDIYKEIENLKKGKKVEGLVIFNIICTVLSIIVGCTSLVIGIIPLINNR